MSDPTRLTELMAEIDFSGVVLAEADGDRTELAAGLADRANGLPNRIGTRFASASMTKGFTAVTVMSLVESGELTLDTTLRSLVGEALPLVDPAVTIEHLLGHRSGVGDYLDEAAGGDIDDYMLGASAHTVATPDDYLPLISPHPQVSSPGERFAYNNGGFVMLSLAVERVGDTSFHELVQERVFDPAGMERAGFLRSDNLPADTALGYLRNGHMNVFHLPVIGGGDGGAYVTAADMEAFWEALFGGRLLSEKSVRAMTTPLSETPEDGLDYGLGFWLATNGTAAILEGMDAGVSCRSSHDPATGASYTVLCNNSSSAWPVVRHLEAEGTH